MNALSQALEASQSTYALNVACMACNREPGFLVCDLCRRIEDAERAVGKPSPQLVEMVERESES